ncbi:bifunctional enoyl-CoA hydratase/phosphate acetyltransferase [Sedimentibacter hydroxybenzoicus DSM 7310]|uniref:Bifunctional enoyl-CoA hydratase/phosphate acetyltransferase n=1 Tax=Sedimentibacter hydroxybenzoicus DSM 7310 TaxID=1123245 RepID=A0A974GV17_SEDHY|nr:bifunctional enoyl-CoA hydratase/phosphate acetyltransferase [Sedimentibacter hydroxybenzoicus]NYB72906.1 bifunctional enoyl-CoA hydratase/phosphate acetyltransferase [Sedimentibacter hydroxybenzoicus DSM 7310]
MELKNFKELIAKVQNNDTKKRVAVAAAHDEHTLEAVFKAVNDNLVEPVLIGDKEKIVKMLDNLSVNFDENKIIHTSDDTEAAEKTVELINEGKADFIMKGKLQTADLLKAVVNKEKGLRTGSVMSHVAILEIPAYHKLIAVTDGGMMMYPNLDEKKQIIENVVNVFLAMGYESPKVAVLAAVETVNPKMPEAVDADNLKKMNQNGEIKNCIVEGPISVDLTFNKESAKIKGYESPVTGEADILIAPNITTGNIMSKALLEFANGTMAGMIVGAKVPIVLTSRGATTEEKYLSLVLSASSVK